MHTLTVQIDVSENDDEIEQEICLKLKTIFIEAASLIDYNANNAVVADIRRV